MEMEEQIDTYRALMRKFFLPGPFLLALTSLANFQLAVPQLINFIALAISIPATLLYVFASWQALLLAGKNDAGSGV